MTDDETVEAIILNYSLMCGDSGDIGNTMQEYTNFMQRFFDHNPDIRRDKSLQTLAQQFFEFCQVFKRLDTLVNIIGKEKKDVS